MPPRHDGEPIAPKHVIEMLGEFLVAIANQEANWFRALRQGPHLQVVALPRSIAERKELKQPSNRKVAERDEREASCAASQRPDSTQLRPDRSLCTRHHWGGLVVEGSVGRMRRRSPEHDTV